MQNMNGIFTSGTSLSSSIGWLSRQEVEGTAVAVPSLDIFQLFLWRPNPAISHKKSDHLHLWLWFIVRKPNQSISKGIVTREKWKIEPKQI